MRAHLRSAYPLAAALLIGSLGGCATMVSGARQEVLVDSNVPGAKALTQTQEVRLPGLVKLSRGHPATLEVSAPGYETRSVRPRRKANPTVALNCLCGAFGLIGLVVDAASGSAYEYPKQLMVRLQPSRSYASLGGPPRARGLPARPGEVAGFPPGASRATRTGRRGGSPLWILPERGARPRPLASGGRDTLAQGAALSNRPLAARPEPLPELLGERGRDLGPPARRLKGPPALPSDPLRDEDPRLLEKRPAPLN